MRAMVVGVRNVWDSPCLLAILAVTLVAGRPLQAAPPMYDQRPGSRYSMSTSVTADPTEGPPDYGLHVSDVESLDERDSRPQEGVLYSISLTSMEIVIGYYQRNRERPSGSELLKEFEDVDGKVSSRAGAARLLGLVGYGEAVRPMIAYLEANPPTAEASANTRYLRYHVIRALGDLRDRRAVPVLLQALKDDGIQHIAVSQYTVTGGVSGVSHQDERSPAAGAAPKALYGGLPGPAESGEVDHPPLEGRPLDRSGLENDLLPEYMMLDEAEGRTAEEPLLPQFVSEAFITNSCAAADALGEIGDTAAAQALKALLTSLMPAQHTRAQRAEAAGVQETRERLYDPLLLTHVAIALGNIGDPMALPGLRSALERASGLGLKRTLHAAIVQIEAKSHSPEQLLVDLRSGDRWRAFFALRALAQTHDPKYLPAIKPLLGDYRLVCSEGGPPSVSFSLHYTAEQAIAALAPGQASRSAREQIPFLPYPLARGDAGAAPAVPKAQQSEQRAER